MRHTLHLSIPMLYRCHLHNARDYRSDVQYFNAMGFSKSTGRAAFRL